MRPAARLKELVESCRLLVLCTPLTEATRGLVDADLLHRLPDGCVVCNVARGPVVDERALYGELAAGRLVYASDVWYRYPERAEDASSTPPWSEPDFDLSRLPAETCALSPHRGGAVGLAETERRRAAAVAAALNAVARTRSARAIAVGDVKLLDVVRGY